MKSYSSRIDPEYLELLCEKLDLEELKKTALVLDDPPTILDKVWERHVRIDLVGLSGSVLLDSSRKRHQHRKSAYLFREFLKNVKLLNEEGIFAKVRFLLVYPYSTFFFSLIEAESSRNRSFISEPKHRRYIDELEIVDESTFHSSGLVKMQRLCLERLGNWGQKQADDWNNANSPNTIVVRFTPFSVNQCILVVNDSIFCDSYQMARDSIDIDRLALESPLVLLEKEKDARQFACIRDHFRYLWGHDLTLDCEDATEYSPSRTLGLGKVKMPSLITYQNKANRLRELMINEGNEVPEEDRLAFWDTTLTRRLMNYSQEPEDAFEGELLFVGCSWKKDEKNKWRPNKLAQSLNLWLENDFGTGTPRKLIDVRIMDGIPGRRFTTELYRLLDRATLAIMIITEDMKLENKSDGTVKSYGKPNIYHEVGYLMSRLEPRGRLIVLCQEGVELPSNVHDSVYIPFDGTLGDLAMAYEDIVKWIKDNCRMISESKRASVLKGHLKRVKKLAQQGMVPHEAVFALEEDITKSKR